MRRARLSTPCALSAGWTDACTVSGCTGFKLTARFCNKKFYLVCHTSMPTQLLREQRIC
jgi:hypothetical protein